jgi:hypothetical protein
MNSWTICFISIISRSLFLPLVRARPLIPAGNAVLRSRDEFGCWSAPLTPTYHICQHHIYTYVYYVVPLL